MSLSGALVSPVDSEIIDLKATMTLGAFNILVCDQTCSMADIKVKGVESDLGFWL